jgi:hypothetical protein
MAEPTVLATVVSPILKEALQEVIGYLKAADDRAKKDAKATAAYLEALRAAIVGIEGEYDNILLKAKMCRIADDFQRKRLLERLEAYVNGNDLREKIWYIQGKLRSCRGVLQNDANAWWGRHPRKKDRQSATADLIKLLDSLDGYLQGLAGWGMDAKNASAADLQKCLALIAALTTAVDQAAWNKLVTEAAAARDAGPLRNFSQHIGGLVVNIESAFG